MGTRTFALCPDCLHWVQLRLDRCPDCSRTVDVFTADPSEEELRGKLGELQGELGEVWLRDRGTMELGILYWTSTGLFFVPHQIEGYWQMVPVQKKGSSLLWTIATLFWSPLMFAIPLLRRPRTEMREMQRFRPHLLRGEDATELPKTLMGNPSSMFISRETIHGIRRKWQSWLIDRAQRKPLKLIPSRSVLQFQDGIQELSNLNTWRGISFRI